MSTSDLNPDLDWIVLPEIGHHVGLRATVVLGFLDSPVLPRDDHVGRVAAHIVQVQLVFSGEGGKVEVP